MTGRGLNNCYMTQCVLAHINVFPTDRLNVDTSTRYWYNWRHINEKSEYVLISYSFHYKLKIFCKPKILFSKNPITKYIRYKILKVDQLWKSNIDIIIIVVVFDVGRWHSIRYLCSAYKTHCLICLAVSAYW